jgi:hypothetical protein
MSRNTTLYPAVAETWAIPCPMTPEPKIVIFFSVMTNQKSSILYNVFEGMMIILYNF